MKPVVANPKTTFVQLAAELDAIDNEERAKRQIEQIIAKIHRKKHYFDEDDEAQFEYNAKGTSTEDFIDQLKEQEVSESIPQIQGLKGLWRFLDEYKPSPRIMLVSEHEDEFIGIERGYGNASKPEDYLENFSKFIEENKNKISALKVICTKPADLDRKSLRELMIALDQEGYNSNTLKVAWRDAKNEDIAADIISFIRTLAVGSVLTSHEERIKRAVDEIRAMRDWNKVQTKWIDRFEMQLIKETVLRIEDLDDSPFDDAGGFDRLNKIFEDQLENIVDQLNKNLYAESA
jgi:type I restriction enzyme R subunit